MNTEPIIRYNDKPMFTEIISFGSETPIFNENYDDINTLHTNSSVDCIINYTPIDTDMIGYLYINEEFIYKIFSNNGTLIFTYSGPNTKSIKITVKPDTDIFIDNITIKNASIKTLFTPNNNKYITIYDGQSQINNIADIDGEQVIFEKILNNKTESQVNIFCSINSVTDNPYLMFRLYINNNLISTAVNNNSITNIGLIANGNYNKDSSICAITVTAKIISGLETTAEIINSNIRILCIK